MKELLKDKEEELQILITERGNQEEVSMLNSQVRLYVAQ
jgi:hypothetical protein